MSNFSSAFKNMDAKIELKRYSCAIIAAVIFAVNIKTFVKAGGLYPGGFNGLTLLIQGIFQEFAGMEIPYTLINVALNAIPVFIGLRFIGVKFTMSSCVVIVLSSILTDLIPSQPITYDPLLISIFGGLINGFVISLCLIGNTSSGGTDFIAIYFSEKNGQDIWNYILCGNAVILVAAGLLSDGIKRFIPSSSSLPPHRSYRCFISATKSTPFLLLQGILMKSMKKFPSCPTTLPQESTVPAATAATIRQ